MEGIPPLPQGMTFETLPVIECECGSKIFEQGFVIKKLSGLFTDSGEEQRFVVPVFICKKCGKELDEESKKYEIKGHA
jgi:DNA-directed RNA polymerase subunit RPC12/RpoP